VRKLTLSMAILAALIPGQGFSLGLGEIELNSALNQELDAEVEVLSAEPELVEQLIVKLASREAFSRSGIDRPYLLQQLKFKAYVKDNKPYISIKTKKPIREPFLSFLVEIDWPEGHLLREYTLLLDPPVYSGATTSTSAPATASADNGRPFIDPADSTQSQPVSQQNSQQQGGGRPAESAYAAPQATNSSQVAPEATATPAPQNNTQQQVAYQPAPQYQEVSGNYRVQQNDTLWSVASRMRPDSSVSVEQMMLALVRENPEAFIKENINGVKRGYILRMPDRASITALDRQEALAQAREHSSLWREYRQSQSGAAPASSFESESESAVSEEASTTTEDGQLSIVSASDSEGSDNAASGQDPKAQQLKQLRNDLSLAREALESERLEKEDLRTRLSELEQQVQNVLQMNDTELAELQQGFDDAKEQAETPAEPVVETKLDEVIAVDESIAEEAVTEESEVAPVEEVATEEGEVAPTEETVTDQGEVTPEGEEALFVDETVDATSEEVVQEETAEVEAVVQPADVPAFAQQKPKNFIETLLDDPKMLAAIGAGILALLATVGMTLRRRRINKTEGEEWVDLDDSTIDDDIGLESDDEATVKTEAMDLDLDQDDLDSTAEMQAPSDEELESGFDDTHIDAPTGEEVSEDLEQTVISLADDEPEEEEERDDVIAEADVYLAYGIYQQAEELLLNAIDQNPDRDDYRMKLLETHFAGKNGDAFAALAEDVKSRKGDSKNYWDRVVAMGRELCPDNAMFNEAGGIELPDFDTDDLLPKKPQTTDLDLDIDASAGADLDISFDGAEIPSDEPEDDATQILNEPLDLGGDLETLETEDDNDELTADADLEFDLGDFDEELEDDADTTAEADDDSASLDIDEDFSLDFDASDLGFEEDEDTTEEISADLDLDSDIDLDIDMETETTEEASVDVDMDLDADLDLSVDMDTTDDEVAPVSDETMASLDAGLEIDLDMDTDSIEESVADFEIDLDMDADSSEELVGDLEVDLDMDDASADLEISLDDDDDFDISELSEDVDEVTTKLDLAKAYIDMGDSEGAKSILEEVKAEGNDEQQQQAEELLKKAS
jgi:pilus assembly protein FimV